jgi:hypothetical protein
MPDQELVRKEENPVSPTMRELAMVLFRQRKLFVGVSGLVFVLAVLYAFAGATYRRSSCGRAGECSSRFFPGGGH